MHTQRLIIFDNRNIAHYFYTFLFSQTDEVQLFPILYDTLVS